jgi:hypothetical protein
MYPRDRGENTTQPYIRTILFGMQPQSGSLFGGVFCPGSLNDCETHLSRDPAGRGATPELLGAQTLLPLLTIGTTHYRHRGQVSPLNPRQSRNPSRRNNPPPMSRQDPEPQRPSNETHPLAVLGDLCLVDNQQGGESANWNGHISLTGALGQFRKQIEDTKAFCDDLESKFDAAVAEVRLLADDRMLDLLWQNQLKRRYGNEKKVQDGVDLLTPGFDIWLNEITRAHSAVAASKETQGLQRHNREHLSHVVKMILASGRQCVKLARELNSRGSFQCLQSELQSLALLVDPEKYNQTLFQRKTGEIDGSKPKTPAEKTRKSGEDVTGRGHR